MMTTTKIGTGVIVLYLLAMLFLFAAIPGVVAQTTILNDTQLEAVQRQINRLIEADGGANGNPLDLITRKDYLDAWRRMAQGKSQLVQGVELPSADAEALAMDCDTCKLLLQSIAVFRGYLDELEAEKAALLKASVPDVQTESEFNVAIAEMQTHLRFLAIKAAECFDRCVPPDKISRMFVPTPFEVPVRAYPGEPVTCRACQPILEKLRKVNAELFVAQQELDRLEALDRYYRSRFGHFDAALEDVPPEGLLKMQQLAKARLSLATAPPKSGGRLLPRLKPDFPLLDDLESTPTLGGRCRVLMEWVYKQFGPLSASEIKPLKDNTVGRFWTWLYGAPYQTTEEVQSFANKGLSKADFLRLEALVLNATLYLSKKLPPARVKVVGLRKQRREILAQLFECHSRQCIPRAGDPVATSPLPVEPPPAKEPDKQENVARGYVDLPPLEPVGSPSEEVGVDEANKKLDGAGLPPQEVETDDASLEVDPAIPPMPEEDLQLEPVPGLSDGVQIGGGVSVSPDGTITGPDGAVLSPQDLAGALGELSDPRAVDDDPEDPEMASYTDAADIDTSLEQQAAIQDELEMTDADPEQVAVRTIPPLPPKPAAAAQCAAAAPVTIAACSRLPEPARATCNRLTGKRNCLTQLSEGGQGVQSCLLSCEATAAQQELNEFILATGQATAMMSYQTMIVSREATLEEASVLLGRISEMDMVIEDMERGRQVFYYENTNTGVIVEHFGERFDPVPPLVYRGEGRLPLQGFELDKLRDARVERDALVAKRDALLEQAEAAGGNNDLGQWYLKASSEVWKSPPTAALWCTPQMFADRYDACRRECLERGYRIAGCLSQYSDDRPELDPYYQNEGLYAPGFERSPD